MWSHFHHEADIGVRGTGPSMAAAFEAAAQAMTAVITDPESVACRETVTVECAAPDAELLFVDWLNALVYEMATRRMLFRRFHVELDDACRLHASACGEAIDVARHHPATEVKGATYTALKVCKDKRGRWRAQCVVDV
ncbi:MAG: archease [Gammaproteobacteria bacterium]|jgi:tRNA nucleotidyltransferase (CCA-adding enzyme)